MDRELEDTLKLPVPDQGRIAYNFMRVAGFDAAAEKFPERWFEYKRHEQSMIVRAWYRHCVLECVA